MRIFHLIQKRGLTWRQVSLQTGLAMSTISRLERGVTKYPRMETLARLAKALSCTIEQLYEDEA